MGVGDTHDSRGDIDQCVSRGEVTAERPLFGKDRGVVVRLIHHLQLVPRSMYGNSLDMADSILDIWAARQEPIGTPEISDLASLNPWAWLQVPSPPDTSRDRCSKREASP